MDIRTTDLEAFLKTFEVGTISGAAKEIGLTQSALSQKIQRLESQLLSPIFIRHPRHLELTSAGEKLMKYAKASLAMQEDFAQSFDQFQTELSGTIRIAGFSSVMRSIIIPKLSTLFEQDSKVNIEFSVHEMHRLDNILKNNSADLIISDYWPQAANFETQKIGIEEYVIIENRKNPIHDVFLDNSHQDNATESFFKFQGIKKSYKRKYMGDVYSIIDGVALGFGSAVMSKHLVEGDKRFIIKKSRKNYNRPIVLSHMKQSYYSPLQLKVIELLSW